MLRCNINQITDESNDSEKKERMKENVDDDEGMLSVFDNREKLYNFFFSAVPHSHFFKSFFFYLQCKSKEDGCNERKNILELNAA